MNGGAGGELNLLDSNRKKLSEALHKSIGILEAIIVGAGHLY